MITMPQDTLWARIKARHLESNVYTLIAFIVLFVVFTVLYALVPNGLGGEIFIAVSTSLLASIFISFFDIYTEYRNFENSQFIENLYRFGIHNLHFDKEDVLRDLIRSAHDEIWVSGYRLILTKDLVKDLYDALRRGVNIRFLVCPPWEEAHRLVYSDLESSLDNYVHIIKALSSADGVNGSGVVETHFCKKPLFNDTYRVDDKIVTSPYMHNRDLTFGVISAGDFFTYELDRNYRLYQLLEDEYQVLWESCDDTLDQVAAARIADELEQNSLRLTYEQKVEVFKRNLEHAPGI